MLRKDLERLSRDELITRAEAVGVSRPRSLTTAELLDEMVLRGTARSEDRAKARGWFGRAKDLLKSALERGLDTPDVGGKPARAASRSWPPAPPPPLPTVTLAEIYAAQGHLERAVQVLDEVLAKDASHGEAARLRDAYRARIQRTVVRPAPATPREEPRDEPAVPAVAAAPVAERDDERRVDERADPAAAGAADDRADDDDLDEVVAVAVDPSTIYLYWEIRALTAARARVEAPGGALTVRAVTVRAGDGAPLSEVRDERVDALSGELFVRGLRDGAHVRVSVGWRSEGGFVPLAVAAEVITPRRSPSAAVATHLGAWAPPAPPVPGPAARRAAPAFVPDAVPPVDASTSPATPQAAPPPARRTVLLQPAEVFDIPGSGPMPIGTWRPPGSSDLVTLYGSTPGATGRRDARYGALHGGASDLVHGGASDQLVPR